MSGRKKILALGLAFLLVFCLAGTALAESGVEHRAVNIWSDGTRLAGDLYYPSGVKEGDKLPAILLCHGWGGVKSHLNQAYAPFFAKAGYVVLTFDYRGWGESDSRLVVRDKMPSRDGQGYVTVRAQAIRELVDPLDQLVDIQSCLDFLYGEPMVNPNKIGLWGTSYGGGHVVYAATHDDRVKCVVSQVGGMDSRSSSLPWTKTEAMQKEVRQEAVKRARGEIDPVPQGGLPVGLFKGPWAQLTGTPYLSRMMDYSPIRYADQLKVPILIIEAEKDELMKPAEHGQRLYALVKDRIPAEYWLFPGTHFEIYNQGRREAIQRAIAWYDRYLK